MAASQPVSERPAEQHRLAQASLALAAARAIRAAWVHFFDLGNLKGSADRLATVVESIAHEYGRASAAAALTDYRNQRRAAGILGRPALKMPTPITHRDAVLSVEHVMTPLYGNPAPAQVDVVEQALESSVEQLVLDQSRAALIGAVRDDRAAKGWARVTEPGACYFCAMLASRGAVYRSKATADFRAHVKQPNGAGGTCRCHVEPFFNKYEPTAQARQWAADWKNLSDQLGHSPSIKQWRQSFEGRKVDAKKLSGKSRAASTYNPGRTRTEIDSSMSTERLTALIGQLERSQAKHPLAATTKRIAELRAELAHR